MSNFTAAQTKQLLAPINPRRVMLDGKKNSHLPQQDVLAHLIRIFGFGSFDYDVLSLDLVFEQNKIVNGKPNPERFDVCYRATMRLTIRDASGKQVCHFEDGSTGDAQNQKRADGHDLAMKSAISLAKKRCAIALGDQFGLSLYNKGQMSALVGDTLVKTGEEEVEKDVQANVPESKSMGIDEIERETHKTDETVAPEPTNAVKPAASTSKSAADRFGAAITITSQEIYDAADNAANTDASMESKLDVLKGLWDRIKELPENERPEVYNVVAGVKKSLLAESENTAA